MVSHLPISSIKCRSYLQQRSPRLIDDKYDSNRQTANLSSTIDTVKTDLNNGQKIRIPLEVHEVNNEYLLVDGHHRYEGALAHCKDTKTDPDSFQIPVKITKDSTEQAAIDASFKVNLNHGVGLTPPELKHLHFRHYVWTLIVPKISEIMSDTGCARGTASNIANAARWCIEVIKSKGGDISTPPMLKVFMTKKMEGLGISSDYLDSYGLASYSLLRKALNGDSTPPIEVNDSREERIQAVRSEIEVIESQYGVEALREGLRRHKTAAHGITVTQNAKWHSEPSTASLLAIPLFPFDDF
jgi:hypothetical protein